MRRACLSTLLILFLLAGLFLPAGPAPVTVTEASDFPAVVIGGDLNSQDVAVVQQADHIVINEFAAKGTEWIELYNPTTATVVIDNWYVSDGEGNETLFGSLAPDSYYSWDTVLGLDNSGDEIMLYDSNDNLVDEVAFGTHGGTPIEPTGDSVARTPNGYDSDDFARDWNLDQDPTRDAANDAPPVALGSSLLVNEMNNYTPPASDAMELFNPTGADVPLDGWWICDGDGWGQIVTTSVVPAGGWLTFDPNDFGVFFTSADVAYLLMPDGTRVDQIGWDGEYEDETFQRICDGWGPNDGYDWDSSWGGLTWFDLPHTLGYTNSHSNCAPWDVDAAVLKDGPPGVVPGERITYTLFLTMTTVRPGEDIVVSDTLPSEVAFYTFTSSFPVTWTGTVSPVVFQADVLYGLSGGFIYLTADVTDTVLPGALLVNTVEITAAGDVTLTNNMDVFTSTVVGAEVAIDKAGPSFVMPGSLVTYTLTYEVMGDPAEGVLITDTLPAVVTYSHDTAPVVPVFIPPDTLVWDLGPLGPITESGAFEVVGLVSGDPMTWTMRNKAWISALTDTVPGNNYAYWDTDLPMPIYEVQHVDVITGTSPSPHEGEHVYVIGAVVAEYPPTTEHIRFVIGAVDAPYGPWQGLFVYAHNSVISDVVPGQLLVLGGTVAEYYGMTEFDDIDYYQVLTEGLPLPDPVLTTTAAITTGSPETAEPLESVLVEVQCAEVTDDDLGFGEWGITDWTGVMARVDDLAGYAYIPTLGDVLNVAGVLFYSYDDFKVEPRDDGDILMTPVVIDHGPIDGGVPIGSDVWASFNISLSASTVNTATFLLEGPAGLVTATVGYDPVAREAGLDPVADLDYDTTYTATLTTGIEGLEGAAMCAEYTWSFTTEAAPAPDLTTSLKVSDRPVLQPGELFSYTIYLSNTGNADASVVITDVLPAEVTIVTGTLPPGLVYTDGVLLWSGVVSQGMQVEIMFQAQANDDLVPGTVFTNVVWIDDGVHAPFSREVEILVVAPPVYEIYLPLIFRNYMQ